MVPYLDFPPSIATVMELLTKRRMLFVVFILNIRLHCVRLS